jgi:hypothetical protein
VQQPRNAYGYERIAFAKVTISAGCSSVAGIIKMTANRYLSRTIITIITIITNAI